MTTIVTNNKHFSGPNIGSIRQGLARNLGGICVLNASGRKVKFNKLGYLGTKQIKEKKENIRMKIKQSNILILAKE